jgi:hypothetical protein
MVDTTSPLLTDDVEVETGVQLPIPDPLYRGRHFVISACVVVAISLATAGIFIAMAA